MNAKTLVCLLTLLLTTAVFSADNLIKSCTTTLKMPDNPRLVESQIEIFKIGTSYHSITRQKVDGEVGPMIEDTAHVEEFKIQPDINADLANIDKLNRGEKLIAHAMLLSGDPDMLGAFDSGIDLKKVRSVTVFTIGEATNMGSAAIVEAKDEKGKYLGSFVGGFLVSPCKEKSPPQKNDMSNCTRELSSEISCPEGVYKFIGGKSGDKIKESLKRNAKEIEAVPHDSKAVSPSKAKSQ